MHQLKNLSILAIDLSISTHKNLLACEVQLRVMGAKFCYGWHLQSKLLNQLATKLQLSFLSNSVFSKHYKDPWSSIHIGKLLEDWDGLANSPKIWQKLLFATIARPKFWRTRIVKLITTPIQFHFWNITHL